MLVSRIIHFIRGFVRVKVQGFFVERFLNICMHRDIYLWNIRHRGDHHVHVSMSLAGFRALRPIARKTHARVVILDKHGLPFFLYRHKKRKAFLAGALLAVGLLVYLTSFVWVIEVTGNDTTDSAVILSALKNHGFSQGIPRKKVDPAYLQNQVMLELDSLAWLWVEVKGTKATVSVREKKPVPKIVDKDTPCNLVAARQGLITGITVTYGEKMVSVGQVVEEGDLLVSGVVGSRYEGVRYLHSAGSVTARTYYKKEGEFPAVKINFTPTGKKNSKNTLHLLDFKVQLYRQGIPPYEHYRTESAEHRMNLGGDNYLPFSVTTDTHHELLRQEEPLSHEQAAQLGAEALCAELEGTFGENTVVVKKESTYTPLENGNLLVTVNYECIEDIARTVEIAVAEE